MLERVAQELAGPQADRARVSAVREELRALHAYAQAQAQASGQPSAGASGGAQVLDDWVMLSSLDFTRLTEPALVLQRRVRGQAVCVLPKDPCSL